MVPHDSHIISLSTLKLSILLASTESLESFFFTRRDRKGEKIIPASIMPYMWANVALFCYFIWLDGIPLQKEMFLLELIEYCVW